MQNGLYYRLPTPPRPNLLRASSDLRSRQLPRLDPVLSTPASALRKPYEMSLRACSRLQGRLLSSVARGFSSLPAEAEEVRCGQPGGGGAGAPHRRRRSGVVGVGGIMPYAAPPSYRGREGSRAWSLHPSSSRCCMLLRSRHASGSQEGFAAPNRHPGSQPANIRPASLLRLSSRPSAPLPARAPLRPPAPRSATPPRAATTCLCRAPSTSTRMCCGRCRCRGRTTATPGSPTFTRSACRCGGLGAQGWAGIGGVGPWAIDGHTGPGLGPLEHKASGIALASTISNTRSAWAAQTPCKVCAARSSQTPALPCLHSLARHRT